MARSGKLIHYKVNPPRKKATCPICLKRFSFAQHDRSQNINTCSISCTRRQALTVQAYRAAGNECLTRMWKHELDNALMEVASSQVDVDPVS